MATTAGSAGGTTSTACACGVGSSARRRRRNRRRPTGDAASRSRRPPVTRSPSGRCRRGSSRRASRTIASTADLAEVDAGLAASGCSAGWSPRWRSCHLHSARSGATVVASRASRGASVSRGPRCRGRHRRCGPAVAHRQSNWMCHSPHGHSTLTERAVVPVSHSMSRCPTARHPRRVRGRRPAPAIRLSTCRRALRGRIVRAASSARCRWDHEAVRLDRSCNLRGSRAGSARRASGDAEAAGAHSRRPRLVSGSIAGRELRRSRRRIWVEGRTTR